jgi:hypothetical protein
MCQRMLPILGRATPGARAVTRQSRRNLTSDSNRPTTRALMPVRRSRPVNRGRRLCAV